MDNEKIPVERAERACLLMPQTYCSPSGMSLAVGAAGGPGTGHRGVRLAVEQEHYQVACAQCLGSHLCVALLSRDLCPVAVHLGDAQVCSRSALPVRSGSAVRKE